MKRLTAAAGLAAVLFISATACVPVKDPSPHSAVLEPDPNRYIPHSLTAEPPAPAPSALWHPPADPDIPRDLPVKPSASPAAKAPAEWTKRTLKIPFPKSSPSAQSRSAVRKPALPVQKLQQAEQRQQSAQRKLTLSEIHRKYPSVFRLRGPSRGGKIALTFDDGPDLKFTPQILDILREHRVKATFFVIGSRAKAHPELIRRMVREGHVVGNHSFSHPYFPKLSEDKFAAQIMDTQYILKPLTGYSPKLIRPPYGAISEDQVKWIANRQLLIVNWDVDSLDWKGLASQEVIQNVQGHAHAGSVVLQHSAGGTEKHNLSGTVEALPQLIRHFRAEGYKLVTIPELLQTTKSK
ncbi:polysaccharide deacetylase family protein [Paenibacillus sp. FJAT-26967]|uniref:polysaccharide deacetylase family protein n=1 Tax=Paenibacillus sp. FJAT-26967 TaxID=1729690 RepID=UPI00083930BC|nr:polysaccharide deacetylase family protein [Paenibacillus sp. FJAT-26967]